MVHYWNEEEKEFLRKHYPTHSRKELVELFNEHFNVDITLSQLKGAIANFNIRSGRTGQFEKGNVPWCKGKKGLDVGGKETRFKKGKQAPNYKPIGSIRINGIGYVDVKIADPGIWKALHVLLWEEKHGPVPKGHCVIFADSDRYNFEPDNLILVTRSQLGILNTRGLIQKNSELTKAGVNIANLYLKINEWQKGNKEA